MFVICLLFFCFAAAVQKREGMSRQNFFVWFVGKSVVLVGHLRGERRRGKSSDLEAEKAGDPKLWTSATAFCGERFCPVHKAWNFGGPDQPGVLAATNTAKNTLIRPLHIFRMKVVKNTTMLAADWTGPTTRQTRIFCAFEVHLRGQPYI